MPTYNEFTNYVRLKGVRVLDMNQFEELNDGLFYSDKMHNNRRGGEIHSALLVEAIYDAGLIK